MLKKLKKLKSYLNGTQTNKVIFRNSKIIRTLRKKIGKSSITVGDVEKFLESNYLFDNKNFYIKKSNYKDLRAYIDQRVIDYCDLKISTEIIKYMWTSSSA